MKVVVTGARGRIGRVVCEVLRRRGLEPLEVLSPRAGWNPAGDRDTVTVDVGDVARMISVLRGSDAVVHCAGRLPHSVDSGMDPDDLYLANVQSMFGVAACAQRAGVSRLVCVGAVGVATAESVGPMHEAYVSAKRVGELITRTVFRGQLVILRPGWVVGPDRESYDRIWPVSGVQVIVGDASLPMVWLCDLGEIIVRSLYLDTGGVFFAVAGQPTQREFYEYARELSAHSLQVVDAKTVNRMLKICEIRGVNKDRELPIWTAIPKLPSLNDLCALWGFSLKSWRECVCHCFRADGPEGPYA